MERAVVLGEGDRVELPDLPPEILPRAPAPVALGSGAQGVPAPGAFSPGGTGASAPSPATDHGLTPVVPEGSWEAHEKAKILEALQRANWNITRAAQLLGMTFRTLQYRLEKFDIRRP